MGRWVWRVPVLLAGWYLAMSFPIDTTPQSIGKALTIGTLGVAVVAITCYRAGRADAS